MAANKLFLDTDIILDFILSRKGELHEIEQILNAASTGVFECYISESVITTSMYVLQKEKKDSLQLLRTVCATLNIIPFNLSVLYTSIEIFDDIEDGLLYFLAQQGKMNFYITRNINDFKNAPTILPVFTPKQFFKYLNSNDIP
jgi:predicted nucleic acid-binding protein